MGIVDVLRGAGLSFGRNLRMRDNSCVSAGLTDTDASQVSVVIPAYNAALHLPATLESIFAQTSKPGEIIVVDDGSTDNTIEIAKSFGVKIISLTNSRAAAARNAGTYAAQGELIAYMDADDLWLPSKLAVQLKALRAFGQPAFSFTDYRAFNEHGLQLKSSGLKSLPAFRRTAATVGKRSRRDEICIADSGNHPVLPDCYILPSSVLVRRADVIAIGGFDETVPVSEDFEFFLRLFKRIPAIVVMQPLLLYRRHAGQQTANQTVFKQSVFDIARRVAASPGKYPSGDARHMKITEYQRYYRLGIELARRGRFDEAGKNLRLSLTARFTLLSAIALVGCRLCQTSAGSKVFSSAKMLWKTRHRRS